MTIGNWRRRGRPVSSAAAIQRGEEHEGNPSRCDGLQFLTEARLGDAERARGEGPAGRQYSAAPGREETATGSSALSIG